VIRQWIRGYQKPDFYEWAIELKELGQAIGSISVVEHDNDVDRCHIG
jgi:ribosomal-protein-alanine N-acetyltransferase